MPEISYSLSADSHSRHYSRQWILAMCLVLSAALHVLVLMLFRFETPEPGPKPQVQALEVVLLQQPPPLPEVSRKDPAAPVTAPAVPQIARKRENPIRPRPDNPPAIAIEVPRELPRAPVPAAPAISVAPATETRAPALETKVERAVAEPLAAPSFNAAYLRNPPPRYPTVSRRNGEQGTVTLRVLVSRDGLPTSVDVETSSGFPPLDSAAREAVRAWRFAPARRGTQAVEAWVLVPVVFRLEGSS